MGPIKSQRDRAVNSYGADSNNALSRNPNSVRWQIPVFTNNTGPLSPENDKLDGLWCEEFQYERRGGTEEIHIITEGESQLNWRVHTLSLVSAELYQTLQLESERRGGILQRS